MISISRLLFRYASITYTDVKRVKTMAKESAKAETTVVKLTRKEVAIILMVFAALLLTVGLLAGLIKPERSSLSVRQAKAFANNAAEPWLNVRLPSHILPIHYDLSLFPDLYHDEAGFSGNVSITINITSKPTRYLLVHANKLAIHRTAARLRQSRSSNIVQVHLFIYLFIYFIHTRCYTE